MLTCPACGGLTPNDAAMTACLHCATPFARRARWLATLVGATGTMLLAACYGPSGRYYHPENPNQGAVDPDADGDGSPASVDCDDHDPARYPGAADPDGDGIDQNCDGVDGWKDPNKIAVPPDAG